MRTVPCRRRPSSPVRARARRLLLVRRRFGRRRQRPRGGGKRRHRRRRRRRSRRRERRDRRQRRRDRRRADRHRRHRRHRRRRHRGTGTAGTFGLSGPTRCDTTLPLCESFESGTLDTTLWRTTRTGDATIAVDDIHAARGTHALHIKTVAGGGSNFAYIKETKTFPATNNVLYGRMFVWFEDALTTDGHFSLAEGAGTGTAGVIRFGGQFKAFGVGTDGGSSGDWTDSDRTKLVPTQTWICAEFQFDGPTHTFHVWWDDMERPMLTSGPSKHASFTMPTFNGLWFGWWMYNLAEPQEIWIDEIAVDYKPIGCAK